MKRYFEKYLYILLNSYSTPIIINYAWNLGSLCGIALLIQIFTGIGISVYYIADPEFAFNSIEYLTRDIAFGWLLRYMHMNGATMLFIVVYLHMLRTLLYGTYLPPRQYVWLSGMVMLCLLIAISFLGYALPWGQMSFWASTVVTGFASSIPIIGTSILYWVCGGYGISGTLLLRFYSLHFVLPFVLLFMSVVHILLLRRAHSSNPLAASNVINYESLWSYFTVKDLLGFLVYMFVYALLVFFGPNKLGHCTNYIEADALVTPLHIVPEWYFLMFYGMLKSIPTKVGGIVALIICFFSLFIAPFYASASIVAEVGMRRPLSAFPLYRLLICTVICMYITLGHIGIRVVIAPFISAGLYTTYLLFIIYGIMLPTFFFAVGLYFVSNRIITDM